MTNMNKSNMTKHLKRTAIHNTIDNEKESKKNNHLETIKEKEWNLIRTHQATIKKPSKANTINQ